MRSVIIFSLLATSLLIAEDNAGNHISVYADALYLHRSGIHNREIVLRCNCSNPRFLNTRNVVDKMGFEPGFRVGAGIHPNSGSSLDGNYLYMRQWSARKRRTGNLTYPFESRFFAPGFTNAERVVAKYKSQFWSAEGNYWGHVTPRYSDYYAFAWILGVRHASLKEEFFLNFYKGLNVGNYNTRTKNWLIGPQVGFAFDWTPTELWMWTLSGKFAPMADRIRQKVFLSDQGGALVLRDSHRKKWNLAFLADVALSLAFRIGSHVNIHGGYQLIYLTGVALAPEQLSYSTNLRRGRRIHDGGNALMQGAFLGIGFGF
jgi:hypothetical protein